MSVIPWVEMVRQALARAAMEKELIDRRFWATLDPEGQRIMRAALAEIKEMRQRRLEHENDYITGA